MCPNLSSGGGHERTQSQDLETEEFGERGEGKSWPYNSREDVKGKDSVVPQSMKASC